MLVSVIKVQIAKLKAAHTMIQMAKFQLIDFEVINEEQVFTKSDRIEKN